MGIYSKHGNVEALMVKADNELMDIRTQYNDSLQAHAVSDLLLVSIKNYLGNLRSALDYLVKNIGGKDFPVVNSQTDFNNKTTGLTAAVASVMSRYQQYNGQDWLKDFNTLNNKNKHFTLTPQIRRETRTQSVSHGDMSMVFGEGASISIGEGASISIGGAVIPGGQTLGVGRSFLADSRLKVKEEIWVDFLFDNSDMPNLTANISALPFLEKSFVEIKDIIHDIEAVA